MTPGRSGRQLSDCLTLDVAVSATARTDGCTVNGWTCEAFRVSDGDIWPVAGAYFCHIPGCTHLLVCMAFPRKPVQNYWQTLVRCDFQLNPLPPANEENGQVGPRALRGIPSYATPLRHSHWPVLLDSQAPLCRAGLGIPDYSALWIPRSRYRRLSSSSLSNPRNAMFLLCYISAIPWFIKHSKYGQYIVCSPAYHRLCFSIEEVSGGYVCRACSQMHCHRRIEMSASDHLVWAGWMGRESHRWQQRTSPRTDPTASVEVVTCGACTKFDLHQNGSGRACADGEMTAIRPTTIAW